MSDCASGLECRAGTCAVPLNDGDASADLPDARSPELDAAVLPELDAAALPELDATVARDAGNDGSAADSGIDASVQPEEDDGGASANLDSGLDASL